MPCSKQTVCGPIDASLAFYLDSKYILKPVNDGMCEWGPDREGTLRFFREGLYCSLTWTRYRKTGKCDFLLLFLTFMYFDTGNQEAEMRIQYGRVSNSPL